MSDHKDKLNTNDVSEAADRLSISINKLQSVTSLDIIRGIEGDAAHNYFSVLDHLIMSQKDKFFFKEGLFFFFER